MSLIFILAQSLFILPVAARALGWRGHGGEARGFLRELAAGARVTPVLVHGIGLILLWIGAGAAVVSGTIDRAGLAQGVLGLLIILLGAAVIAWSAATLPAWRLLPEDDSDGGLCDRGPYRFVRHPIYLAIDLLGVGTVIWTPTPIVLIAAVLLIVGGDLRSRLEERALLAAFGDAYRRYCEKTKRLVPGVY
jgi:protein-S-isoprenylcysteine O-methyltransferase Ste14